MRGLDLLRKHGVEFNILTAVHAVNGDHGRDVYRFVRDDLGARYWQLIPIVERVGPWVTPSRTDRSHPGNGAGS